ncbi:MAG: hypothetical protein HKN33_14410 [Pyrinomonadaceae bacterium]|nr:hypothetical protein [Pyrinomonadaceae bacterium]
MKTFFRVSMLGLLLFAFVAVSNQTVVAQEGKAELYAKFTDNYDGDLAQRKIAVAAGKEFIRLYGNSADDKEIVDYLKSAVPAIEEGIKEEEEAIREQKKAEEDAKRRAALFKRFDGAFNAKNWTEMFSAGDAILKDQPDFYDVAIVLATAGFDEAANKNDSLNNETIRFAKLAIQNLKSGKKPKSPTCGGNYYPYNTDGYKDCVSNSLGWMNYYIGWIKFYRQQQKDEAVPYFFEATKHNSGAGQLPVVYQAVGSWYVAKASEITAKRNKVLADRNAETKVEEPDEAKIDMLDAEIDKMIAIERGYAERAIDAYSRAYSLVSSADRAKDYGKGIFTTLQQLYKFRYEKPEMQTDTKINMNVSMIKTKAMPDPASTVEPVVEKKPEAKDGETAPAAGSTDSGASRSRTVSNNN